MQPLYRHTLKEYFTQLASRAPVPGGGSAAALVATTAAALICMVARYSQKRSTSPLIEKKIRACLCKAEVIRQRLCLLIDLDAKAYLGVVKTRKKNHRAQMCALRKARQVPLEVCRLSYQALQLTPVLVRQGNPHLLSDIECAVEMLSAAFHAAMANVRANQKS